MTSETRTLIQFADLSGIEVRCPHCEVRLNYSFRKFDRFSPSCPNCNEMWFSAGDVVFIKEFIAKLVRLQESESVGKLIRLQLAETPE